MILFIFLISQICVPIEEFKLAHILFLFKHRSSNEAKDKTEKPFALSFTPLMQANGTTLNDMVHYLRVYKVNFSYNFKQNFSIITNFSDFLTSH